MEKGRASFDGFLSEGTRCGSGHTSDVTTTTTSSKQERDEGFFRKSKSMVALASAFGETGSMKDQKNCIHGFLGRRQSLDMSQRRDSTERRNSHDGGGATLLSDSGSASLELKTKTKITQSQSQGVGRMEKDDDQGGGAVLALVMMKTTSEESVSGGSGGSGEESAVDNRYMSSSLASSGSGSASLSDVALRGSVEQKSQTKVSSGRIKKAAMISSEDDDDNAIIGYRVTTDMVQRLNALRETMDTTSSSSNSVRNAAMAQPKKPLKRSQSVPRSHQTYTSAKANPSSSLTPKNEPNHTITSSIGPPPASPPRRERASISGSRPSIRSTTPKRTATTPPTTTTTKANIGEATAASIDTQAVTNMWLAWHNYHQRLQQQTLQQPQQQASLTPSTSTVSTVHLGQMHPEHRKMLWSLQGSFLKPALVLDGAEQEETLTTKEGVNVDADNDAAFSSLPLSKKAEGVRGGEDELVQTTVSMDDSDGGVGVGRNNDYHGEAGAKGVVVVVEGKKSKTSRWNWNVLTRKKSVGLKPSEDERVIGNKIGETPLKAPMTPFIVMESKTTVPTLDKNSTAIVITKTDMAPTTTSSFSSSSSTSSSRVSLDIRSESSFFSSSSDTLMMALTPSDNSSSSISTSTSSSFVSLNDAYPLPHLSSKNTHKASPLKNHTTMTTMTVPQYGMLEEEGEETEREGTVVVESDGSDGGKTRREDEMTLREAMGENADILGVVKGLYRIQQQQQSMKVTEEEEMVEMKEKDVEADAKKLSDSGARFGLGLVGRKSMKDEAKMQSQEDLKVEVGGEKRGALRGSKSLGNLLSLKPRTSSTFTRFTANTINTNPISTETEPTETSPVMTPATATPTTPTFIVESLVGSMSNSSMTSTSENAEGKHKLKRALSFSSLKKASGGDSDTSSTNAGIGTGLGLGGRRKSLDAMTAHFFFGSKSGVSSSSSSKSTAPIPNEFMSDETEDDVPPVPEIPAQYRQHRERQEVQAQTPIPTSTIQESDQSQLKSSSSKQKTGLRKALSVLSLKSKKMTSSQSSTAASSTTVTTIDESLVRQSRNQIQLIEEDRKKMMMMKRRPSLGGFWEGLKGGVSGTSAGTTVGMRGDDAEGSRED
jgi:hypothetical protein